MNETTAILSRLWEIKNTITREGAGSPRGLPGGYELVAESAALRSRLAALRAAGTSPRLAGTQPRPGPIGPGSPHRSVTSTRAPELDIDPIGEPRWLTSQVARVRARMRPWDLSNVRLAGEPLALGAELRSRALTAVERTPGASDPVRQAGTRIVEQLNDPYGRLARGILALSDPLYLAAWGKLARNPASGHHEWSRDECRAVRQVQRWAESRENRAMSLTDTAGGYLVPFQLDPTVTIAANGSVNQIRQVARQVIATGDVWNGVSSGAVAWSYDAEAAEVSDDATTWAQPTVPIYKAQGFVPILMELFEDAPNATAAVADALAFGKDALEADAFTVGTGIGMPTGIVTALTGTPSVMPAATAGAVTAADVYTASDSLPSRYGSASTTAWLANRTIYSGIRQSDGEVWASPPSTGPATAAARPPRTHRRRDGRHPRHHRRERPGAHPRRLQQLRHRRSSRLDRRRARRAPSRRQRPPQRAAWLARVGPPRRGRRDHRGVSDADRLMRQRRPCRLPSAPTAPQVLRVVPYPGGHPASRTP